MPTASESFSNIGFYPAGTGKPPTGPVASGGATQDRANIDYLLNPYTSLDETRQNAAEANLGAGVSGSGFASGTTNRLLDSERIARMKLGHELLEPYLQRDFQAQQGAADRAARLNEIAAQGAQALQQLQLSEAGQSARLSQEEKARMEQLITQGNQAMAQLQLQEAGQSARLNTSIRGNILGNLIQASLSQKPTTSPLVNDPYRGATGVFPADSLGNPIISGSAIAAARNASAPRSGAGTIGGIGIGTIDNILRKYNLI